MDNSQVIRDTEMFRQLWESGYRFVSAECENTGLKREVSPGVYEFTTLKGFKALAVKGEIAFGGRLLNAEDAELVFNVMGFVATFKNKSDKEIRTK